MPTQHHRAGEGYSANNPIPTIQEYEKEQAAFDKSLPPTPGVHDALKSNDIPPQGPRKPKTGAEQKKEMMDQLQPPKGTTPLDQAKQEGNRWEKDPTTGVDVLLKNPEFEHFRKQDFASVNAPPKDMNRQDARFPAPSVAEVGNINIQPFPPELDPIDTSHAVHILRTGAQLVTLASVPLWYFVATGHNVSWFTFFFRTSLIGGVVSLVWIATENAGRKVTKELERIRMKMHTARGQQWSPPTPESAEWMNALIRLIWGLINPDMFVPIVDMVEDILQASLPSFITAVRLADIGQGTNPLRIVSMRALPDQPGRPGYPQEEWVGMDKEPTQYLDPNISKDDEDQTGDYLNYEVSISYQALPHQSKNLRFHNMHLMLEFFVGAFDWFKVPIPIYTIIEGFVATARLRVQFVQSPPFVRNVTITLMGVPKVEVSVEPFTKKLPNVLDLPFIQKFVEMGIAAACAQYVAPKSLTLNLAQMLVGDGLKKDTKAVGIIVVTIHHAIGLLAQDRRTNSSDPYIVLAYAKFGKPLYSTRIITGDLNPVWEETAFLLVSDEEINAEESLSLTLWDWDKHSADDLVGRIVVPLSDIMAKPNTMTKREDKLQGFEDANDMPGTLYWEFGYYNKMPLNKALKKPNPTEDKTLPAEVAEKKEAAQAKPTSADTQEEADVLRTPPDPNVPSGILSVIVHQINNLERQDIKGKTGDGEGQAGQDTDEPAEEGKNLPNSYCEIIVNDDMIYKTRVKQYSSMPYFEAGTERFIRDWREAVVRIQVRDARTREKDPVLGVISVNLCDLFKESSEVTRLFSLQEGVGYGRANISFLFRQVKLDVPRALLGWETGTVEVLNTITITPTPEYTEGFDTKKLELSTTEASYKAPSSSATIDAKTKSVSWSLPTDRVRLPIYHRYASAVVFEIGSGGFAFVGQDCDYIAVCWLKDLVDNEETPVRLPVLRSDKIEQLRQNYINDETFKTHSADVVGYLTCTVVLDSGLDPDHEDHQVTRPDKHRYEAYDRVEGQAQVAERNAHAADDGVIDRSERKQIEQEKKHQLHMRHRGIMQHKPARTAVWSSEGLRRRARSIKEAITGNKTKQPTVESEV